jgi:hypothetical protein
MEKGIEIFVRQFTGEHRIIRDLLLDMITGLITIDAGLCLEKLGTLATVTGPHFRYEEESIYPVLSRFYGDGYVEKLFTDHDMGIGRAFRLKEIIETEFEAKEARTEAINHVRGILPHVSDCQGLVIFAEKFEAYETDRVLETMKKAQEESYDLLSWASEIRRRRHLNFLKKHVN